MAFSINNATAAHVTWIVVRCISPVLVAGFVTGISIYVIVSRWIQNLLFGVNFADPLILAASLLVVFIMAGAAAGVPRYRPLQIDPVSTLRSE
jgi:hypothetical protein